VIDDVQFRHLCPPDFPEDTNTGAAGQGNLRIDLCTRYDR
jgi:hypothetical protein